MKLQKESNLETLIYALACILSLGMIYVTRIIITYAIRKAFDND